MKIDFETLYKENGDIIVQTYRIKDIARTLNDAVTNCMNDNKDSNHILPVLEYLENEAEQLICQEDSINEILLKFLRHI